MQLMAHARLRLLPNGLVHGPSYPRGNARTIPEETGPLGGEGKIVEIDETYVGGKEKNKHRNKRKHLGTGGAGKEAVFALVERKGNVRSHHISSSDAKTLRPILQAHVDAATLCHDRRRRCGQEDR